MSITQVVIEDRYESDIHIRLKGDFISFDDGTNVLEVRLSDVRDAMEVLLSA